MRRRKEELVSSEEGEEGKGMVHKPHMDKERGEGSGGGDRVRGRYTKHLNVFSLCLVIQHMCYLL